MARRRDQLDPEAFGVKHRTDRGEYLDFTAVAAAAVDAEDIGRTLDVALQRLLELGDLVALADRAGSELGRGQRAHHGSSASRTSDARPMRATSARRRQPGQVSNDSRRLSAYSSGIPARIRSAMT